MNTLTPEQQHRIETLLREGRSLRAVQRITGHRRETIAVYGRLTGILPRERGSNEPLALAA